MVLCFEPMRPAVVASALFLVPIAVSACQREDKGDADKKKGSGTATKTRSVEGAPKLELYVMSQCPYGTEVVDAVAAAHEQLAGAVNLDIQFIGDGQAGNLQSMHGPNEVVQDAPPDV